MGNMLARSVARVAVSVVVGLLLTLPVRAQEGHPMSGSWVGDWGPNKDQRTRVVVVMNWNGKTLGGTINPGPNGIPIKVANVDTNDWRVHLEGDGKDAQGKAINYVIDGAIDDLGTYNRSIVGTCSVGGVKGDISITRQ
jgi:hypothetical protein